MKSCYTGKFGGDGKYSPDADPNKNTMKTSTLLKDAIASTYVLVSNIMLYKLNFSLI